jgi:hypothetical protein
MRAYELTTGSVFAAVTIAHILRIVYEDRSLAVNPPFILLTVLTSLLTIWGFRLGFKKNAGT